MNNEDGNSGYYKRQESYRGWAELTLKAIGGLALGIGFLYHGCALNNAELKTAIVDAEIKERTRDFQVRLANLEQESLELKNSREKEQSKRDATPLLVVTPTLAKSGSHLGVTDLQLEVIVSNAGLVKVPVRRVRVISSIGVSAAEFEDAVVRTQQLHQLGSMIAIPGRAGDDSDAAEEYRQLHANCPHGQMFAVSPGSPHVKWESVPELDLERVVDINLLPKEAFAETFVYTLTEPLHHRGRAFRFRVEVDESNPDKTVAFEFVVPLSPGTQFDERSVRRLETGTRREQWKPEAPLAPTGIEN